MSQSQPSAPREPLPGRGTKAQERPPDAVTQVVVPALQVGAGAGAVGLLVGAAAGIVRSSTPVLFSLATSAQWFALGSSYYASRQAVFGAWGGREALGASDTVKASTIAGGCAGLVGGLIRGPRNLLPGVIVFSLIGAGGQAAANAAAGSRDPSGPQKKGWLDSKWSPLVRLTDEQYREVLQEKILRLEAEIAIADDAITALRASGQGQEAGSADNQSTKPS